MHELILILLVLGLLGVVSFGDYMAILVIFAIISFFGGLSILGWAVTIILVAMISTIIVALYLLKFAIKNRGFLAEPIVPVVLWLSAVPSG